jgi:hypothetical protein
MPGRKYSDHERELGIAAYVIEGSFKKAEELTGIDECTIRYWRDHFPDQFERVAEKIRTEYQEEHRAKLTKIITKSLDATEDRLDNGDERVLTNGEKVRVQVSGKDAAWIAGLFTDKLRISLGQPTSITAKEVTTEDRLSKLRESAKQKAIESGEVIEIRLDHSTAAHESAYGTNG